MFPVPMVPSLNEVSGLFPVATACIAQLERPQEVVGLLKVWPHGEDLMNKVLHAYDAKLAQFLQLRSPINMTLQ